MTELNAKHVTMRLKSLGKIPSELNRRLGEFTRKPSSNPSAHSNYNNVEQPGLNISNSPPLPRIQPLQVPTNPLTNPSHQPTHTPLTQPTPPEKNSPQPLLTKKKKKKMSTTTHPLPHTLLRPTILHILRSQGFHSARPTAIDALTSLTSTHLQLLARLAASHAYDRALASASASAAGSEADLGALAPTVTDVRRALTDGFVFGEGLTPAEEDWREALRRPLGGYVAGAREREGRRRDAEDTGDVREFVEWCAGVQAREMRRIAGVDVGAGGEEVGAAAAVGGTTTGERERDRERREDWLTGLKKRHSKTGEGARYAGTVIGKEGEERRVVRIEGGVAANLGEWSEGLKRKRSVEEG